VQEPPWAGSAGIDVAPEVMKALTKVDPTIGITL
jgi:hypothetical protein